ncbi:TMV resistance protein N isoform X3 [Arachis ipaensis]|uniref:TMV resistance protein N isoform X3 n=1 Tax=Arachis ipaensis TaxID=130454 RepID=UPI000A2B86E1|nr:TMV resistance protein N isoform X3 [Arachis ipaensis]
MITDVPSSSSSSSPSVKTRRWINHVFISFRGADSRKGFTDHLYAALERRGCIKTFKDDHDLESGEIISKGLIKGIQESMFALVVLSPNYASSRWCLDELQNIVECREKFNQVVFPIFYGVESSDVRYQRGTFEEAFRKHEERFKEEKGKVQRWRDALQKVASYSGWDSKDNHEAALIERIVDHIQKLLIPKLPSSVGNLVGVESRMKKLNSLIGMQLDDVRFIGIWGMGGIGKTTTARLIYESIEEQFNFSCFLANIREVSAKHGIVHIQKELLSHLSVRSNYFHNLFDGVKIIANSLHNKKVLLVLDDISERSQLENLAGKQEWFGPGSRIIITTRDKHLLMAHGVHQTCELEGLVQEEALHLFCLKAFKQDQPKSQYQNLCSEVVEYTRGLPLALEVLGSHLCGRTPEAWHSALKQIRSSPHPEIQNSLKISFESLSSTEREIFLDIACFFKGMDKDEVVEVLENCGHFSQIGIEILIEKSLVTLGRRNQLEMHDLLQEMGKNIVFQESPNDPGKRSRLWSQDDISRVLSQNKGTEAIQAIVDDARPYEARWSSEAFSKTSNIRLLKIRNVGRLSHGLECLPYALRVLDWQGCPLKTLPLTDQLDVVDINLSWSKIEQLWHGTKILHKLKCINLSFSGNLNQTPDFVEVPNLESLVLEGCTSLTEIHSSVMHLKKLVQLNLKGCKRLKALPGKMEMSSLKVLNLSGCSNMNTVPDFGNCMGHLAELHLDGTAVTELPSSLGCLVGLVLLHLQNCMYLVCLPDTIHKLKSLKVLNVSYCSKLRSLPECLQEMNNLEELYASNIEELPLFLYYLGNIKAVSFAGCKGPTSEFNCFRVPSAVCGPSLLIRLDLSYCNLPAESIPDGFCGLSLLRDLDLSGNNFVNLPSDISKHTTLEYLCLNWCKKLQSLPELPLSIKSVDASNCASLVTSKFHPSSKCSIFASLVQWHLPRERKCLLKGICFPRKRFDMFITGNKIPSWFAPQKSSSFAEIPFPHPSPPTEWLGYALCFLLVADRPLGYYDAEITCFTATQTSLESRILVPDIQAKKITVPDKDHWRAESYVITRSVPLMEPKQPHLYILFLSIGEYLERMHTGYGFGLTSWSDGSLRIVQAGCRLVCKEDLQDIYGNHSHTSSVGPNEKNQKINNNDGPSS